MCFFCLKKLYWLNYISVTTFNHFFVSFEVFFFLVFLRYQMNNFSLSCRRWTLFSCFWLIIINQFCWSQQVCNQWSNVYILSKTFKKTIGSKSRLKVKKIFNWNSFEFFVGFVEQNQIVISFVIVVAFFVSYACPPFHVMPKRFRLFALRYANFSFKCNREIMCKFIFDEFYLNNFHTTMVTFFC